MWRHIEGGRPPKRKNKESEKEKTEDDGFAKDAITIAYQIERDCDCKVGRWRLRWRTREGEILSNDDEKV